jgi:ABC-type transport system involved in cytochrome c biogenesis permease subunit
MGHLITERRLWLLAGFAALVLGLALNTIFLAMRWGAGGQAPLASLYDVLLVLAAGVALFAAAAEFRRKAAGTGLFAGTAALLLLGYASTLDPAAQPLAPVLRSNILVFHVGAYIAGYAACALACGAAVAYLLAPADRKAGLERLMHGFVLFAFPFLTAGMSLGMLWADRAWGRYWGWDPKESWSLIVWLISGYSVHLRLRGSRGGRRAAWLSIAGFAAILFTLFGVNVFCTGLHSYR